MLSLLSGYLHRYAQLSAMELHGMEEYFEMRHFGKGVTLIEIGQQENYLNFIVSGLVRKFFFRGKEEVITQLAKEGDLICSSVSFLSSKPSEYIVETIEPTSVVSLSREGMEAIYAMSDRMERLGRLITTDWLLQKEHWENERIMFSPKQRFVNFVKQNPDLWKRVPQKFLASYLNMTPETFSRYKHTLDYIT